MAFKHGSVIGVGNRFRTSAFALVMTLVLALGVAAQIGRAQQQSSSRQAGEEPESPAAKTAAPSIEEICKQRLNEKDALESLGKALEAFNNVQKEVEAKAPSAPPSAATASGATTPTPRTVFRQAEQAVANLNTTLAQASDFNSRAESKIAEAARQSDPAIRERIFREASENLNARDGLVQGATTRVMAAVAERAQEHTSHFQFHSETFERLQSLASQAKTLDANGRIIAAERNYDNAAHRALETINRAPQTRFFEVPSPVVQAGGAAKAGGIKFSSKRAEELASLLDITSIEFDPATSTIMLAGNKSTQKFDLDVFADVLRLAVEEYEPFFSLDSSDPRQLEDVLNQATELVGKKYPTARTVADRIKAISPDPIIRSGKKYYFTTLDVFDPKIVSVATRGRDFTTKLVYSPAWLRYSKVGQILYEADLAIKSVAGGFLDRDGALQASLVWDLPDFDPMWLHRVSRSRAGRANFILARTSVTYRGDNRLDLAEIHPELYVTEQRPGTDEDLPPSQEDRQLSAHFERNWRLYVERVPEIARLHMVYRAYVAARFLADKHPGLAERIQKMPRSIAPHQPPMRIIVPIVMHAWDTDDGTYVDMSSGYGGGIAFELEKKNGNGPRLQTVVAEVEPNDWLQGLLAAASYKSGAWEDADGRRAAALVQFDVDTLPASWHVTLALGIGIVILAAAGFALFLRHYDWQRLPAVHTCAHCARVHRWLGSGALSSDILASAALAYIAMLPITAAAHDATVSAARVGLVMLSLAGFVLAFVLIGGIWTMFVERTDNAGLKNHGPVPLLFAGARLACVMIALFLFHSGFSTAAVARNLSRLVTPQVAERVLGMLGGTGPIAWAVSVGLLATMASIALRWLAPRALNSRPLARYSFSSDAHSHQTSGQ